MKFRKKPIVIEAFQYDGDLMDTDGEYYVPDWAIDAFSNDILFYDSPTNKNEAPYELYVKTLEGYENIGDYILNGENVILKRKVVEQRTIVNIGDYVVQGVNGKLYVRNPNIFEKTYDVVEE